MLDLSFIPHGFIKLAPASNPVHRTRVVCVILVAPVITGFL
jgi:hypothetical protein